MSELVTRPGRREDAEALLGMIIELAEYEKEADQVRRAGGGGSRRRRRLRWPQLPEELHHRGPHDPPDRRGVQRSGLDPGA